jgi:hypothetical protein
MLKKICNLLKEQTKQEISVKQVQMLDARCLFRLFLYLENGGKMYHRNFG